MGSLAARWLPQDYKSREKLIFEMEIFGKGNIHVRLDCWFFVRRGKNITRRVTQQEGHVCTYNNNRLRSQAYIAEIVRKQETSFRQIMTRAPRRKHGITRYDDSLQEDHQSGIPARLVREDAEEECRDDTECVASGGKNVDVDDAPAVPF